MLISKLVQTIKEHYKIAVAITLCVFVAIVGVVIYHYKHNQLEKPVVITQQQSKSPVELSKTIHVTDNKHKKLFPLRKELNQQRLTIHKHLQSNKLQKM